MKKVWIDTDPGIDDALAIAMLLESPEIDIVGISSIFGNATIEHTTRNAALFVESAGLTRIPFAKGAALPLNIPLDTSPFVHGVNGLGDMPLTEPDLKPVSISAAEAIVAAIRKNPGEITLFPIGPLTNIALALRLDPSITALVKEVVIMGGAVHVPGNITPVAEANFFHDPHAARVVLNADWPVTIAGLDVCGERSMIPHNMLDAIAHSSNPLAPYIEGAMPHYLNFIAQYGFTDKGDFPDALAAAYLLDEAIFEIESIPLYIETEGPCMGQSVPVRAGKWYQNLTDERFFSANASISSVNVLLNEDGTRFLKFIEDLLV